jgi:hypothetical protein
MMLFAPAVGVLDVLKHHPLRRKVGAAYGDGAAHHARVLQRAVEKRGIVLEVDDSEIVVERERPSAEPPHRLETSQSRNAERGDTLRTLMNPVALECRTALVKRSAEGTE